MSETRSDITPRFRHDVPLRYPVRMTTLASPSREPQRSAWRSAWLRPFVFATLTTLGMAALWVLVALFLDRHCAWMSVIAAADIALMLRLIRMPKGRARSWMTVICTLIVIVLANWGIAAAQMGQAVGMRVFESLFRLGGDHASTLLGLANSAKEWAWYTIALFVAWWLERR